MFLMRIFRVCLCYVMLCSLPAHALKIGVTLHPYYSYVANIIKDKGEVIPLIPEGFNPHAYEPRAQDILSINQLDVVVLNDIGHDDFARTMIKASENPNVVIIQANKNVPLLSATGLDANNRSGLVNPHTFISITASMIQIHTIAEELSKLDPDNAQFYQHNARAYTKKLRTMRSNALAALREVDKTHLKIATVHGGYDYLLREFGLEVAAVIEPAHGIEPSPSQLLETLNLIEEKHIDILFTEQDNPNPYSATIAKEAGIRLAGLTHITHGSYEADTFEKAMQFNLNQIVEAIKASQAP